ncbi:MAG: phosphoglycerate dehydrogenase [Alphaproteobacteria bacterium]|nr:phosphoglycerate dehydrogenase [Alphaproteobacteria bacterium]
MRIVFHGENAATFVEGFAGLLDGQHEIIPVGDDLTESSEVENFRTADIIIGTHLDAGDPRPENARAYLIAAAGYDAVDFTCLASGAKACNCHGHERPIAEYVIAGMLAHRVPLVDADACLRKGDWAYRAGPIGNLHDELTGGTVALIGYGHISQEIARMAKTFDMRVYVANRSKVATGSLVDAYWPIDDLAGVLGEADFVVSALPLMDATAGLIGAQEFGQMKSSAVLFNVGRGGVVEEKALYEALRDKTIAGAVIDTWYIYPSAENDTPHPSEYPIHELDNVIMTPHMSGWTFGTIRRRREEMAANVNRLGAGEDLKSVVF